MAADPHDLQRFIDAQADDYPVALAELAAGEKRTHWMWYIFPQVAGLGFSPMAQRFAIRSRNEAAAYVQHPILGPRLHACAEAVLAVNDRSARQIMGTPDDLKLRSSMTLFAQVSPSGSVFERVLQKYFASVPDAKTTEFLQAESHDDSHQTP